MHNQITVNFAGSISLSRIMDHVELTKEESLPISPSWRINVSETKTVKVSSIPLSASNRDVLEFFSFSKGIRYIEMQRESETTQSAYVTFKDYQGAETAVVLTGAILSGLPVSITLVDSYQPPPNATPISLEKPLPTMTGSAVKKAEDVVSAVLAKGYLFGKDALYRAKSFDERHHLIANASATIASVDNRIGFSEKLSMGTAVLNERVREMDERFQVSDRTKLTLAAAEQKASSAGSAIIGNSSWVTSTVATAISKAAEGVSTMTKEKVDKVEEEKREAFRKDKGAIVSEFTNANRGEAAPIPVTSADDETHKLV